jgi:hypothetical protein
MRLVKSLLIGIIGYIISNQLITSLVTGTSTGDTLIQQIVPIAVGVGVVWVSLSNLTD